MSAAKRSRSEHLDRVRAQTVRDILASARRQLAEGEEICLRVVGRDIGVTAAALYRYFPSLSALTHVLAAEVADSAIGHITAAVAELWQDGVRPTPGDEMAAAWRVIRALAIDEPQQLRVVLMHGDVAAGLFGTVDALTERWATAALAGEVISEFAEGVGAPLSPWQRDVVERSFRAVPS